MDKTTLATAIIVIALGVAAFLVFFSGGFDLIGNPPDQPAETSAPQNQPGAAPLKDPLKSALEADGQVKCQFTDQQGVEGDVFVKAGDIRIDAVTAQGIEASIIFGAQQTWAWQKDASEGIVFTPGKVSPQIAAQVPDRSAFIAQLTHNQETCRAGAVEDSRLEPPEAVSFQNLDDIQIEP